MTDAAKVIAVMLGFVVVVIAVALISFYGGIFGNNVHANYNKRVVTAQIQQNVRTKEFAQAAYEAFFKDCNDVVAMNAQIENSMARVTALKAEPDDNFGQKATRVADAQSDLTGLENLQLSVAARYNAAAAEYTRGQFKDENLPAQLVAPFNYQCQ